MTKLRICCITPYVDKYLPDNSMREKDGKMKNEYATHWIIVGIIIMKEQEQEKYRIRLIIYGMEW